LIACLRLTYKANVSSICNSVAFEVVRVLEKEIKILSVDPYVNNTTPLHEAIINSQIIVILVAHSEFLNISKHYLKDKVVLDFVGALT
jgi:UDP-N-acetyl-D-mannosaminuronate dehydrogenase